jgi:hypothetical protein
VHFEGREIKSYGDYLRAADLVVGRVYFRTSFVDMDAAIPELVPLVFIGRDLRPGQPGLYFQDAASYVSGDRYDASTPIQATGSAPIPSGKPGRRFERWAEQRYSSVYEFERALDELLACSIRRRDWDGEVRAIQIPGE